MVVLSCCQPPLLLCLGGTQPAHCHPSLVAPAAVTPSIAVRCSQLLVVMGGEGSAVAAADARSLSGLGGVWGASTIWGEVNNQHCLGRCNL